MVDKKETKVGLKLRLKAIGELLLKVIDALAIPPFAANRILAGIGLFILLSVILAKLPALVLVSLLALAKELLGQIRKDAPSLFLAGLTILGAALMFLLAILG